MTTTMTRHRPSAMAAFIAALLGLHSSLQAEPYTPAEDDAVLFVLDERQQHLAAVIPSSNEQQPINQASAIQRAQAQIRYSREQEDPRFLGYAQATLAPFSQSDDAAVVILIASIEQQRHQFSQAQRRLKALLKRSPNQAQGWLLLANIQRVQGQFSDAQYSCQQAAAYLPPTVTILCQASIQAMTGHTERAYAVLQRLADSNQILGDDYALWLQTILAELALQQGLEAQAQQHIEQGLNIAPTDNYLRLLRSDVWLQTEQPERVIADLAPWQQRDGALLRLAIAGKKSNHTNATRWANAYAQRTQDAQENSRSVHLREHARYQLEVANQPQTALALAKENWQNQKELADLRLLQASAKANNDMDTLRSLETEYGPSELTHDEQNIDQQQIDLNKSEIQQSENER